MKHFLCVSEPLSLCVTLFVLLLISACGARMEVAQIVPTERPTETVTFTPSPSRTPGRNATPTITPTQPPMTATGGPSPTSLFGPTRTPAPDQPTATRVVNPNAPRIEFFTSDVVAAAPGSDLTLYWSTRGTSSATIYRLDRGGIRNQLWNVAPDGSLTISIRSSDRDTAEVVLSVGEGDLITEQILSVPLACPDAWFFQPSPGTCPSAPPEPSPLIEERFERGRMLYVEGRDQVYALFNDGVEPGWIVFENRFDPAIHAELEESFSPPPGLYQPLRVLGFVWRGSDVVRNRLGLGLEPEFVYEGFVQSAPAVDGSESLYISSADGTVLQLLPGGTAWQIIVPPET